MHTKKHTGETDLSLLLKTMRPVLNTGEYTFCTVENGKPFNAEKVLSFFRESEAITLIMKREHADAEGYDYVSTFAWISLKVHSSLEATGLTAAFSTALAQNQISCNVVAAYYHDHLFVPTQDAEKAIAVLKALST